MAREEAENIDGPDQSEHRSGEEAEAAAERIRCRARLFAGTPFDWKALKLERDADRP